jgi:uncharacterized protein with FMN-binding domain
MQSVNRKKRIWPKVVLAILIILALAIAGMMAFALLGKDSTQNLQLEGVSASALSDGVYLGHYDGFRWSNAVEVTVKDHRIAGVSVTKPQVTAQEKTISELTNRVLSAQSTAVDTVSSATVDSKAFLKAIENALNQAG